MAASMQIEQPARSDMPLRTWSAPQIGGRTLTQARGAGPSEELQGPEKEAWQEAEAAGRAAGLAAAQRQIDERIRKSDELNRGLTAALNALARPLAHIDEEVHAQIAQLAVSIARGLLRRELRMDPTQVIGIVRETVALLPASARGVRVLMHPEDAVLVRERLPGGGPEQAWTIAEDPVLARGDCRVQTEYAQVDARIETRLNAALQALLGDERAQARGEET